LDLEAFFFGGALNRPHLFILILP